MPWDKSTDPEELRLFLEYKIKFFELNRNLPSDHQRSFRAVQELGKSEFVENVQPSNGRFWNWELHERAEKLRAMALRTQYAGPELHWRLEIESIVYERFHLRVNCESPGCEGRLWRSKMEVSAEVEGHISDGIASSKTRTRQPCQCLDKYAKSRRVDIYSPFTNTADEMFVHHGDAHKEKLKNRKPDRVFGINSVEKAPIPTAYPRGIRRQIRSYSGVYHSPFKNNASGGRVLFPFLIAEAKSGKDYAADFLACQHQTAFPIWKLLHLQEELEKASQNSSPELGGPLVWFFANRGAIWKLYGCYIRYDMLGNSLYIIHELWEGSILDLNGALRLLLIVDYIFDWARDLYLPNIQRQFEVPPVSAQPRPAPSQPFGSRPMAYRPAPSQPASPNRNKESSRKEEIKIPKRAEELLETWRRFPVVRPSEGFGFAFRYLEDGPRQGWVRALR